MQPADYNEILRSIHYSNVVLRSLVLNVPKRRFTGRNASAPTVAQEATFELVEDGAAFTYEAVSKFVDTSSDKVVLMVSVIFEVTAYSEDELSDEFCNEFIARQLPILVRPYLREILFSVAPRCLVTAPPLPTQFVPARTLKEPGEDEDDDDLDEN